MMKKKFVLSEEAIRVLKMPELKLQLMVFFGVNDARTVDTYLKNNLPDGPLMNYNICGLIIEYAPHMTDATIYRRLSSSERDALNKTKQFIRQEYKKSKNEKDGENNQNAE